MQINKAHKMQHVHYDIRGPVSVEATQMEQQGIEIIKLNTGNPAAFGFKPAPEISRILEQQLQLTAAYSDSKGLMTAREAIAQYERSKGIPNVQEDNIFTGNGVSELISISLQALLNEGDEILIPTPDYPLWTATVRLCGGTSVHYRCDEAANWFPDVADLKRKITPKTKAIVIISPNNPTGAVYPKEILEAICDLARAHKLLIFSDEIYDRLLMDDHPHHALAALAPDLPVVTFNGLSKSHQLCGFRCGWMTLAGDLSGAEDYMEGLSVLASMRLCANVPSQAILPAMLANAHYAKADLLPGGRLYEQREQSYQGLVGIPGISVVKSMAGLYMFPRLDASLGIKDDEKFVLDLLRAKHVLLTSGSSYNWDKPDHFRMVYLPEKAALQEVMVRLKDFLASYQQ